ncbi:MAG: MFS transporter, partial [Ruaniaceae bacterium]|nr:MFS transporter [Ruaniaceae bacterium]
MSSSRSTRTTRSRSASSRAAAPKGSTRDGARERGTRKAFTMIVSETTSRYRWVVLFAVFPMIVSNEIMWLSIAPVSSMAQEFYGVGAARIDILSISFMLMFILFSVPASWVIDRFGFRTSLIIGALLTAIFGMVRAGFADNFTIVLISQFLIAIGQPFLLNISTKVPANWFPITERSTAAGILTMAQYVGFAVPMLLSPLLAESMGIPHMLWIYAIIAAVAALVSIGLTRERPAIAPPGPVPAEQVISLASIRQLLRNGPYVLVLIVCFVSIGVFNTILTVLESILLPRGITSAEAGVIGAVFVLAGVV